MFDEPPVFVTVPYVELVIFTFPPFPPFPQDKLFPPTADIGVPVLIEFVIVTTPPFPPFAVPFVPFAYIAPVVEVAIFIFPAFEPLVVAVEITELVVALSILIFPDDEFIVSDTVPLEIIILPPIEPTVPVIVIFCKLI